MTDAEVLTFKPAYHKAVPVTKQSEFIVGCDLGQAVDFTVLALVHWRKFGNGTAEMRPDKSLHELSDTSMTLRGLTRLPLGTSYPEQISYIADAINNPLFEGSRVELVVDQTGVGRGVIDHMRAAGLRPTGITITAGRSITMPSHRRKWSSEPDYNVGKVELINTLITALNCGDLKISDDLPERDTLEDELKSFRRRLTPGGSITYAAMGDAHDDTVLATALAVWWASRKRQYNRVIRIAGYG